MSIFDIFKKKKKSTKPLTSIKIGDWVTQYSVGYWKVVNIFPKYADEDYSYDGKSWKKGDRLGDWIILKKGFTPKMKPSNACECVDSLWCKRVDSNIKQSIDSIFSENPKAKANFENAPSMPKPAITNAWMSLTDEQAESLSEYIKTLPERFTSKQFWNCASGYKQYLVDPSRATHILHLYSYLWEIDEKFDTLYLGSELDKL